MPRRSEQWWWIAAVLFLVLHGIASTCLPEKLDPFSTLWIVLAEMGALTAALRTARKVDSPARLLWWLLAAAIVFHSTAMSLDFVVEATGAAVFNHVPGLSVFFSMLSGVPLVAAVSMQFDRRILRVAQAANALLSLAIGSLLYVQIFSLLTLRGSTNPADAVLIARLFDGIDLFLAAAATVRWIGAEDAEERRFFRIATIFLWLDAVLPAIHNRILMRHDFVWLDLFISTPYAVLAALILQKKSDGAEPAWASVARLVQSGSGIFLSIALLVIGVITARTHFWLGMAASLLAIVVYGALSTLAQSRGLQTEESLLTSKAALEGLVGIDSLTGISNRRAFDEAVKRECSNARRTKSPVSLLMIDVDEFKEFNDTNGHMAGDRCLIGTARTLREGLPRVTDIVARYGGDEFSAILPATDAAGAREAARRICESVAAWGLSHPASSHGIVTISVGIATCDGPRYASPAKLVHAADRALYDAKRRGRNRCEFMAMDAIEGSAVSRK
jgi:diguanylate cyclase (GGDEF)-like protein